MIIALDYDETWTRDPNAWYEAVRILRLAGHTIYGVTMRYPREATGMDSRYDMACEKIFFTGRLAKQNFMLERGIKVDVWIDDTPDWILRSAK